MKTAMRALLVATVAVGAQAVSSPIDKVIQLLTDLQAKVTADGEESKKLYTEFAAWCEDRAANLAFEIKTGESSVEELKATIDQASATITALSSKVETLVSDIATDEADLKAASEVRAQEAADYAAEEKELTSVLDSLQRAINILEREMRKGGAAMLQLQNAAGITEALTIMVQATMLNSADAGRLTALVQSNHKQADSDADSDLTLGAPAAAVYESKSGSIITTLQDLSDKAQAQLSEARKKETNALHNFELLKQSLEDEIKFANKDLDEAKAGIAAAGQKKSGAEGELTVVSKDLEEDKVALETVNHDCSTRSQEYEAEVKSRDEELKVLAEAKKIVTESTSGAAAHSYDLNQVSLLQVTAGSSKVRVVERIVRGLASKYHAPALAQLATRVAAAASRSSSEGVFDKIKGLISDMIAKLEEEASADASHKAYCDKELAEAHASKDAKTTSIEKLTTKIDQMSARSAQLKNEVAQLQKELALLAQSVAEQTAQRQNENAAYVEEKANLEQGVNGVKKALQVLREYYGRADHAHSSGEGAASGIIGLLEVCESDFSKNLAEVIAAEESAAAAFKQLIKDAELEKTAKEQDVKYKEAESTDLDKATAEATGDRSSVQAELDAVLEYLAKLEEQCIAKAEPYAEKVAKRAAEINGLKEALQVLESETALVQKSTKHALRGIKQHIA